MFIMNYTSLLSLLSTLSWNPSSDNIIRICNNTNISFNKSIYIYHDDFSQKTLKQYNCSCHINGNKSKIDIQHLTLINNKNTTLLLNYDDKTSPLDFKSRSVPKCSTKLESGTILFMENGGISQFLFRVKSVEGSTMLSCTHKLSEISPPDLAEVDNSTLNDQILLQTSQNNTEKSSINIGMILTVIGISMIFISIIISIIFLRKHRQNKQDTEKVINTHIVSEIIPEKAAEIKSTKVSETKPCEEDYEFCEITEYYTLSKEASDQCRIAPNLPSKPPPIKQVSVDITQSSDIVDTNSPTEFPDSTSPQTERYSNYQLKSKPTNTNQGETTTTRIVNSNQSERNSNHSVDDKSGNQSVLFETGQYDYDNVDDIEDTYNHLESTLSPKTSLNTCMSSIENIPNQTLNLHPDSRICTSQNDEISSNNQTDNDIQIVILNNCPKSEMKDKRKQNMTDKAGHKACNHDDYVKLRSTGTSSTRSHSDTKLLNNSDESDFDNVVRELVQRSKSCSSTIDNQQPEMIIIENDLYESMDG